MRIEHIAMYVNDLEKAKDFFVHYFNAAANEGYHNKVTDFRSYFLSFDDGARLEIMTKPQMTAGEKALDRTGYIHIAFSLGSKQAVDELTQRLRDDGYPVASEPRMTGDGYYESCIIGIEGNQIELTAIEEDDYGWRYERADHGNSFGAVRREGLPGNFHERHSKAAWLYKGCSVQALHQ